METNPNMNSTGTSGQPGNATPNPAPVAGKNIPMGVLSYLGPLVIVSFLTAKEDPSVKFHIKQGLVLLAIEVVVYILSMMMGPLWIIWYVLNLATLILSIVGIVNVVNGREKELPVVGKYSSYFKF